jgi:fatty-acid desaturase
LCNACLPVGCCQVIAPFTFSWRNLAVALVLYLLTNMVGICLAYHRLLTHRWVVSGNDITIVSSFYTVSNGVLLQTRQSTQVQ